MGWSRLHEFADAGFLVFRKPTRVIATYDLKTRAIPAPSIRAALSLYWQSRSGTVSTSWSLAR
jgi:hypothetical protein